MYIANTIIKTWQIVFSLTNRSGLHTTFNPKIQKNVIRLIKDMQWSNGGLRNVSTSHRLHPGARTGVLSSRIHRSWDPDWGDKVNSGIGLLYQPDRLHTWAGGPVRQPYAGVDFNPPVGDLWIRLQCTAHTLCAQAHSWHMMAYRSAHFLVMMFQHNSSSSPSLHLDDLGGRGGWGKSDQKGAEKESSTRFSEVHRTDNI